MPHFGLVHRLNAFMRDRAALECIFTGEQSKNPDDSWKFKQMLLNLISEGQVKAIRDPEGSFIVEKVTGASLSAQGNLTSDKPPEEHILQFFAYSHLPDHLQAISAPFGGLAQNIVNTLPRNPERTVALRKLLESKDAAVRAFIAKG